MSLNDKMTDLANAVRNQYGILEKLSLDQMAKSINGLEIHNFLDSEIVFTNNSGGWLAISGLTVDLWNKYLVGKTVTISFDAEWTGYQQESGIGNRFGIEIQSTTTDGTNHWNNCWVSFPETSGKQHFANTSVLSSLPVKSIDYCNANNQLNKGSTVKLSNFKLVVNPLGG